MNGYDAWLSARKVTAEGVAIDAQDRMIASDTPDIELFLRNKRRADLARFDVARTVLCVHGSSYPAETAYDLPLDGYSWMDHLAIRGFDMWLVDVRGYGRSTRPSEMAGSPSEKAPVVRTATAVQDVASAVDFVLKHRSLEKLNLVGWSWGTTLMGAFHRREQYTS